MYIILKRCIGILKEYLGKMRWTHDRRSKGEQHRTERRELMNQDQEWKNCSESPKSKKPGQRRTHKKDPQDVGKRRESNHAIAVEITSRMEQSGTKTKTAKGQRMWWCNPTIGARSAHFEGCQSRPRVQSSYRIERRQSHLWSSQEQLLEYSSCTMDYIISIL